MVAAAAEAEVARAVAGWRRRGGGGGKRVAADGGRQESLPTRSKTSSPKAPDSIPQSTPGVEAEVASAVEA